MPGYLNRAFPYAFFQQGLNKTQLEANHFNKVALPYNGFRRITSHFTQARQYPRLRSSALSDHAPFLLHFAMNDKNRHNPYLVPWSQYYKQYEKVSILSWNIMMRGKYNKEKDRFNNAFKIQETEEEYRLRMERIVQNIGDCVRRHPEVAMIFLQEAPVNKSELMQMKDWFSKYLPDGFILNLDATSWGILTLINQQIFPELKKLQTVYTGSVFDMNTRKSTVSIPGFKTQLTNLHLPHDNPEDALKLVMDNLVHALNFNIIQNNERYGSFVFTGDWNLTAKTVERAATQAVENLFHHRIPIRCDVSVVESLGGHIKTDGSIVDVDCSLAVSYKVSHRDLRLVQNTLDSSKIVDYPVTSFGPRY